MMDTRGTYMVMLWDHDLPAWSPGLASVHLDGPSSGLSWRQLGRALRELRKYWDDVSIFVEREN